VTEEVANWQFSAVDVRKWWKNLEISRILPIFAASEELFWLRR